jgi:hypothetical protein
VKHTLCLLIALLPAPLAALYAAPPMERSSLVSVEFDAAALVQWRNGSTTPVSLEQATNGPASVVWNSRSEPFIFGMSFSNSGVPT